MRPIRFLYSLRHAYRRSLYDQDNNIVFIPISKNASTSVEHFIIEKISKEKFPQKFGEIKSSQSEFRLMNICGNPINAWKSFNKSFRFTIVRDPIGRFISAHDMIFTRPEFLKSMEKKTGHVLKPETAIDTLIEYLRKAILPDPHFLPQSYFIDGVKVNCKIRLGVDGISDKLTDYGLGRWVNGFQDRRINVSDGTKVFLSPVQTDFLNHYYEADFQLMLD